MLLLRPPLALDGSPTVFRTGSQKIMQRPAGISPPPLLRIQSSDRGSSGVLAQTPSPMLRARPNVGSGFGSGRLVVGSGHRLVGSMHGLQPTPPPMHRSGGMIGSKFGSGKFGSGKFGSGKVGSGKFGSGKFGAVSSPASGQFGSAGRFGSGAFSSGKLGHSGKLGALQRHLGAVQQHLVMSGLVSPAQAPRDEPSHVSYMRKLAAGVRSHMWATELFVDVQRGARARELAKASLRALTSPRGGSRELVTEVASTEELEQIAFWKQADPRLATEEVLRKRLALRTHPLVLEALHPFWLAALRSQAAERAADQRWQEAGTNEEEQARPAREPEKPAATTAAVPSPRYKAPPSPPRPVYSVLDALDGGEVAVAVLERDGYFLLFRRLFRVLLEGFDTSSGDEDIEEDWANDSAGRGSLTREQFGDALFELADTWCHGVCAKEYSSFLDNLFSSVAMPGESGHFIWRELRELSFDSGRYAGLLGHNDDETSPHPTSHRSYIPSPHRPLLRLGSGGRGVAGSSGALSLESPRRQRSEVIKAQRRAAVLVQSVWRGHAARKRSQRMNERVCAIQAHMRARKARKRFMRLRASAGPQIAAPEPSPGPWDAEVTAPWEIEQREWRDPSIVAVPPLPPRKTVPDTNLPGLAFNMQAANSLQWEAEVRRLRMQRVHLHQERPGGPPPQEQRPPSRPPSRPSSAASSRTEQPYKAFREPPVLGASPRKPGPGTPHAAWRSPRDGRVLAGDQFAAPAGAQPARAGPRSARKLEVGRGVLMRRPLVEGRVPRPY